MASANEYNYDELSDHQEIDDLLFDLLAEDDGKVNLFKFWACIKESGIHMLDVRLKKCRDNFQAKQLEQRGEPGGKVSVDRETFKECINDSLHVVLKAFKNDLVIPEFKRFCQEIKDIYEICKDNTNGKVNDSIPQLARVSPNNWGVSICTIDGQRFSLGESNVPFCLQSCCKTFNYAIAVSDLGADKVHQYVGQEPSGRSFNELTLDHNNQPHNPMINAGAIAITSLLEYKLPIADRFDNIFQRYNALAGGEYVGFSNATYLSERDTSDRNFAIGYYMRENKCFPEGTDLKTTLEFYFQLCSVEVTCESAAVIAATLANGGICPTTEKRILAGEAVRNTLSLMHSCGMYDYSGEFAFKVGLPAKSGISGAILLVVPNVMGICCWSPALDGMKNSCRGVEFCQRLVDRFNFHNYDDINHAEKKMDPRRRMIDNDADAVVNILFGAANGDVTAIRRFAMTGLDMGGSDYDGRTALHLAAAEGHMSVVKMLLEQCQVQHKPQDRWDQTPLDEAKRFGNEDIVKYLTEYESKLRAGRPPRRRFSSITLGQPPPLSLLGPNASRLSAIFQSNDMDD